MAQPLKAVVDLCSDRGCIIEAMPSLAKEKALNWLGPDASAVIYAILLCTDELSHDGEEFVSFDGFADDPQVSIGGDILDDRGGVAGHQHSLQG
jgi:hypothetical protein